MPKNNQCKKKDISSSNEKKERYYKNEINRYNNGELKKDELINNLQNELRIKENKFI